VLARHQAIQRDAARGALIAPEILDKITGTDLDRLQFMNSSENSSREGSAKRPARAAKNGTNLSAATASGTYSVAVGWGVSRQICVSRQS